MMFANDFQNSRQKRFIRSLVILLSLLLVGGLFSASLVSAKDVSNAQAVSVNQAPAAEVQNTASLTITVIDPAGMPITGYVQLINEFGYIMDTRPYNLAEPFVIDELLAGERFFIMAWPHPDYIPGLANSMKQEVVLEPGPNERELMLNTPLVTGQILSPDDTPLPTAFDSDNNPVLIPAFIKLINVATGHHWEGPTSPSGDYALAFGPGEYKLTAEGNASNYFSYTNAIPHYFTWDGGTANLPPPTVKLTYPSFKGQVKDPQGNPLTDLDDADACVTVWLKEEVYYPQDDYTDYVPKASWWTCDGSYQLGGVPSGVYRLVSEGLPEYGFFESQPISVTVVDGTQYDATATQNLDLFLTASQLRVSVLDTNGVPTAGQVVLLTEWGDVVQVLASTPNIPAAFGGLAPGDYLLQAWPTADDIPQLANSVPQRISVQADDSKTINLTLRSPDVVGQIVQPDGTPFEGFHNLAGETIPPHEALQTYIRTPDWSQEIFGLTNQQGQFALALSDGNYLFTGVPVQDLDKQYTKSLPTPIRLDENVSRPIDLGAIKLTYPSILGVVLTPQGTLIETSVELLGQNTNYYDYAETWFNEFSQYQPARFGGLYAGTYLLRANPPGINPAGYAASPIETVSISPGSQYDSGALQVITFTLGIPNLTGRVAFPDNEPAGDIEIHVHDVDFEYEQWAISDGEGRFNMTLPAEWPADTYIMDVYLPPYLNAHFDPPARLSFTWPPATTPYDVGTLLLQEPFRPKTVNGTVLDQNGNPPSNAQVVAWHQSNGSVLEVPVESNGDYTLHLTGGTWELGVESKDPRFANWVFDDYKFINFANDNSTETKTLDLKIMRYAPGDRYEVTGVITTPNATAINTATLEVSLCTNEGHCMYPTLTAAGEFSAWVPPNMYNFFIWVDPNTQLAPPAENDFEIFVDEDLDLGLITLRDRSDNNAVAQVQGQVIITPTGQGLSNVPIVAWTDEGDFAQTTTITNGNFALRLFPGRWHGGPELTSSQRETYFVLPPKHRTGILEAGETVSAVNYYLVERDAVIQGRLLEQGSGLVLSDTIALVTAKACDTSGNCFKVQDTVAQGGNFQLNVVGGYTYTLNAWLPFAHYLPLDTENIVVNAGATVNADVILVPANTYLSGPIVDENDEPVLLDATITGRDSQGQFWVEDFVWPERDPYEYKLAVPTPEDASITWSLRLKVDPASGYIPDPSYPTYAVTLAISQTEAIQPLRVVRLSEAITGSVMLWASGEETPGKYMQVFAKGLPGSDADGLYFEAQTNLEGHFEIPVLPGAYQVGVYVPPRFINQGYFPPQPQQWETPADSPLDFVIRQPLTATVHSVSGLVQVLDASSQPLTLPATAQIEVFAWSPGGSFVEVPASIVSGTANINFSYSFPALTDTVYYVWAAYEDATNQRYYISQEERVEVGTESVTGVDLTLTPGGANLPEAVCEEFDASSANRFELPAYGNLLPPLLEIQAGTFPVTGDVQLCATPKRNLPNGQNLVGFAYYLEARDSAGNLITANFNKDIRIIFYYDDDVLGDTKPSDLIPAFYSTSRGAWVALEDAFVDDDDNFVTGKTDHFTSWGVLSTLTPASESLLPSTTEIYLPLVLK